MTEEKNPKVTIIIQTFNRRHLLPYALESAKNQTYKNIEILIGDNHSEDETEQYCIEQTKFDCRIKYFRHSENIGMISNANFLLDKVTGDYFVWLNDDDWLELDYVGKCIEFFNDHPDYTFVTASRMLHDQNRELIKTSAIFSMEQETPWERVYNYFKFNDDTVSGVFRTDIMREFKHYNGKVFFNYFAEDVIIMMRFLFRGKAKMIDGTYLHKLENGRARVLEEIPSDIFDVSWLKNDNFFDVIYKNAANVIDKEPYSNIYLNSLEKILVKNAVWRVMMRGKYNKIFQVGKFLKICFRISLGLT